MDDFYVTIPYGLVVLGGGIAGYVKRGSAASLAAGAGFGGALLLAGALSIWAFARHSSSLFATVLETARGCWSLPGGRKVKGEEADATVRRSGKRGFAETIDLKLKLEPALAATLAVGDEEVADGVIAAEPVSSPGG